MALCFSCCRCCWPAMCRCDPPSPTSNPYELLHLLPGRICSWQEHPRPQRDAAHVFGLLAIDDQEEAFDTIMTRCLLRSPAQAFESFAKANAGVFETVGVSHGDAQTKMRLMALLGLGAQSSTLSFQDVQVR